VVEKLQELMGDSADFYNRHVHLVYEDIAKTNIMSNVNLRTLEDVDEKTSMNPLSINTLNSSTEQLNRSSGQDRQKVLKAIGFCSAALVAISLLFAFGYFVGKSSSNEAWVLVALKKSTNTTAYLRQDVSSLKGQVERFTAAVEDKIDNVMFSLGAVHSHGINSTLKLQSQLEVLKEHAVTTHSNLTANMKNIAEHVEGLNRHTVNSMVKHMEAHIQSAEERKPRINSAEPSWKPFHCFNHLLLMVIYNYAI